MVVETTTEIRGLWRDRNSGRKGWRKLFDSLDDQVEVTQEMVKGDSSLSYADGFECARGRGIARSDQPEAAGDGNKPKM